MFQKYLVALVFGIGGVVSLQQAMAAFEMGSAYELTVDAFYQKIRVTEVPECQIESPPWFEPNRDQKLCMHVGSGVELILNFAEPFSGSSAQVPAKFIVERMIEKRSSVVFMNPFLLFQEPGQSEIQALPFTHRSCNLVCQDLGFSGCNDQKSKGSYMFNGAKRSCIESVGAHRVANFPKGQNVCRPLVMVSCSR